MNFPCVGVRATKRIENCCLRVKCLCTRERCRPLSSRGRYKAGGRTGLARYCTLSFSDVTSFLSIGAAVVTLECAGKLADPAEKDIVEWWAKAKHGLAGEMA